MDNIYIIVAVAKNNAIGYKNNLLCHIPEDLKYFKNITKGNTIVVGSNTYRSFPKRPLPDRLNIILSKNMKSESEEVLIFGEVKKVLEYANNNKNEKIFICGGESIYKQFIPYASKIYITKIDKEFEADTYFPNIDTSLFKLESSKKGLDCEKLDIEYAFEVYTKV